VVTAVQRGRASTRWRDFADLFMRVPSELQPVQKGQLVGTTRTCYVTDMSTTRERLRDDLVAIEGDMGCDLLGLIGPIVPGVEHKTREALEAIGDRRSASGENDSRWFFIPAVVSDSTALFDVTSMRSRARLHEGEQGVAPCANAGVPMTTLEHMDEEEILRLNPQLDAGRAAEYLRYVEQLRAAGIDIDAKYRIQPALGAAPPPLTNQGLDPR
jgi:hypothetical protein